jgi:ribonuclease HII
MVPFYVLCGVDEAGKGAVIGPMVVAAVGCESPDDFSALKVRDSKDLTPKKRTEFYAEIMSRFHSVHLIITPAEIDAMRKDMSLNAFLARAHATVISRLRPDVAYVDACDVIASRFGQMVAGHLDYGCRIVSEHHADQNYRWVSAASIVAKVIRDREITGLAEDYGSLGSGYPSDPVTIEFLTAYIEAEGRPPTCARWSWHTVRHLMHQKEQASLFDFC